MEEFLWRVPSHPHSPSDCSGDKGAKTVSRGAERLQGLTVVLVSTGSYGDLGIYRVLRWSWYLQGLTVVLVSTGSYGGLGIYRVLRWSWYLQGLTVVLVSTGSYGGLGVFEGLDGVVRLLHVERLLHELVSLTLVPEDQIKHLEINIW